MSFVRVRLPNGYEATLPEGATEGAEVLPDVPATNLRGFPLPASRKHGRPIKPRTTVNEAAAVRSTAHAWLLRRAAVAAATNKTMTGGNAEGGKPA